MAMINLTWNAIGVPFELAADSVIATPWIMVCEDLGSATTHLKLKATGNWVPMSGLSSCGPDGLAGQSFSDDNLLLTDCPVGALIGRIGGSSASLKTLTPAVDAGEGKPLPVGSQTVLKLPDKFVGPLYLGFNILFRPVKVGSLRVQIEGGS